MKATHKNYLITAVIAAVISAAVVYTSNNIDAIEDVIG